MLKEEEDDDGKLSTTVPSPIGGTRGDPTPCNRKLFSVVCQVLEDVAQPFAKPNAKTRALLHLLGKFNESADRYPILRLILPQLDRDRHVYNMKETNLAKMYSEVLALPAKERERLRFYKDPSKLEGTKAVAGNFGSVLFSVLRARLPVPANPISVGELNDFLDQIQKGIDFEAKKTPFFGLIRRTSAIEQKWIARVILKDMKLGVAHERLLKELHPDAMEIFNRCADLKEVLCKIRNAPQKSSAMSSSDAAGLAPPAAKDDFRGLTMFQTMRPMLAERIHETRLAKLFVDESSRDTDTDRRSPNSTVDVAKSETSHSGTHNAEDDSNTWYYVEPKLDGERVICHVDTELCRVEFYTRRANDYTYLYGPPLGDLIRSNVRATRAILDGEMMSWDSGSGSFIPFGSNRTVALGGVLGAHMCFVVFDILYFANSDGDFDLMQYPLRDRRKFLLKVMRRVPHRFEPISYEVAKNVAKIKSLLDTVIRERKEGLVLKLQTAPYVPNSRRGGWFKLKHHYGSLSDTLDLLVIAGYFGDGARRRVQGSKDLADHVSHFLLGVLADGSNIPKMTEDGKEQRVVSFCKVGTGYNFEQLAIIRDHIRPHIVRYTGPSCAPWLGSFNFDSGERPDVVWRPSEGFIMEVIAAEVIPSEKFETGVTLRFPRCAKPYRHDKSWNESWTQEQLRTFAEESWTAAAEEAKGDPDLEDIKDEVDSEDEDTDSTIRGRSSKKAKQKKNKKRSSRSLDANPTRGGGGGGSSLAAGGGTDNLIIGTFQSAKIDEIHVETNILSNCCFYVISGEADGRRPSKVDIERYALENGAMVTQSFRPDITTHVVAAQTSFRTRSLNKLHDIPIFHFAYIEACIDAKNQVAVVPRFLIHASTEMAKTFRHRFDCFGDSYTDDIAPDDFRYLAKMISVTNIGDRKRDRDNYCRDDPLLGFSHHPSSSSSSSSSLSLSSSSSSSPLPPYLDEHEDRHVGRCAQRRAWSEVFASSTGTSAADRDTEDGDNANDVDVHSRLTAAALMEKWLEGRTSDTSPTRTPTTSTWSGQAPLEEREVSLADVRWFAKFRQRFGCGEAEVLNQRLRLYLPAEEQPLLSSVRHAAD